MGVEYYLVCIREELLFGKGVEPPRGRGRLSGARESQLFFGVPGIYKNVFKGTGSEYFVVYFRAYIYVFGWLCRATCSFVSTSIIPYYTIMLLGNGSSNDVQMDLRKHFCCNIPPKQLRLPSST